MKTIGSLTADQMLAQIRERDKDRQPDTPDDGAMTTKEWAAFWKIDRYRTAEEIRSAVASGLMERVDRKRQRLDGVVFTAPCYRWVGEG